MSIGYTPQHLTVLAQGDGEEFAAVTFAGTVAQGGAGNIGEMVIGFADHGFKIGQAVRINYACTSIAISGAAIDGTERRLKTAANGRLIPWTAGSIVAAVLMQGETAAGAGEKIRVFVMAGQSV